VLAHRCSSSFQVGPLPNGLLSDAEAATLPLVGKTMWQAIDFARIDGRPLKQGSTVVISRYHVQLLVASSNSKYLGWYHSAPAPLITATGATLRRHPPTRRWSVVTVSRHI
jgi:hypothetical protein